MSAVAPLTDHYLDSFDAARAQLPGQEHEWLVALREAGIAAFAEVGFPAAHDERWKYTSLRALLRHSFTAPETRPAATPEALAPARLRGLDCHLLVFVDGVHAPALSAPGALPAGVALGSLERALDTHPELLREHLGRYADTRASGFSALNTAFMRDGAFLRVAERAVLERPLHLVYLASAHERPPWHPVRNLIVCGAGSQATVIETWIGAGESVYLSNAVTEIALGENASLEHYKLQEESLEAFHVATQQVHHARDSRYLSHSVSVGSRLARTDINVDLDAEGAECNLYGLYVADGRQHVDFHTRIDHRKPHGTSREHYKGVLRGRARAVFDGQVYVHPDAQRTDAEQSNKNLLLSEHAEVDTKPQLEIYADDVKCSHGATVGQLDETMLFYLRSRGIDESLARGMLTYGFAHDLIEKMGLAAVRENVEQVLIQRLPDAENLKGIV